jgi:nanoRNase/pAp phosphatase (c-di-AMP/oligoRNAs hydrolase)
MKYDTQISDLKNFLPSAKNILIALPQNADIDKLASGLALFLTLDASGKKVNIACDDTIRVGQSYLFGIDHIQKNLPSTDGGNLTISLEGVAASDGTIPALEKLDWFAENNNLNLVFHVLPGQTFQPNKIVPKFQGSGFDLIFVVGAPNLNTLGNFYTNNQESFSGIHTVNIDTKGTNTGFGQTNILDTNASSIGEIMANLIPDLGYNLDADSASNLLAGVFEATKNLVEKSGADTYMVVANLLRAGGKKPQVAQPQSQADTSSLDLSSLIPKTPPIPTQQSNEYITRQENLDQGAIAPDNSQLQSSSSIQSGSPEERPAGERVVSDSPEPDWLTPKIFKGSSLG